MAGRPTVITEGVLQKLEMAFFNGATDKEAIFQADISSSAFYDYCKENPEFAERKEQLKDQTKYQARMNVAEAIREGDKQLSQWYLERKAKEEFSTRTEQTGADGAAIQHELSTPKTKEIAKRYEKELKENL